jgi:uncharacterized membrane protein
MMSAADTAVPPTREFTAAWIAYALFAIGAFLWWPALIGWIVCLARRGDKEAGFIDSHYRWLARTFGWSLAGYVVFLAILAGSVGPPVHDILVAVEQAGGDWEAARLSIKFDWESIFRTIAIAVAGAFGLIAIWFWFIYRVVRGAFRLGAAQPVP